MVSSFGGGEITPDPNSQTMLEWWIHKLAVLGPEQDALALQIHQLAERLSVEKTTTGLTAASLVAVRETLERLAIYSFRVNGILEEAWQRSVIATRSGKTYPKVGSKFADNFKAVLGELAESSPNHADQIMEIGTNYVNKHHLMLKSLYPDMQILHENLLHAGVGSKTTGNSVLHKAMHELTALNGKLDYSKMDPDITQLIRSVVTVFGQSPGHEVFS